MVDLTNDNHKRGLMVLTSKDVRTIDRTLFNYAIENKNVECRIECVKELVAKYHDKIDDTDRATIESCIKSIQKDIDKMAKNIGECRKVFM